MSQGNGRRTFTVSRGLEYFSESELRMQVGRARHDWPVAILKELVDNALDACETDGVDPLIVITTSEDGFVVKDNGPGIPEETIRGSLDYNVRVSDKLGYVTPTRGRLGNALMCVWAAPFVDTGESRIRVRARGLRHDIHVRLNRIEQAPSIDHTVHEDSGEEGTEIHLTWPESARYLADPEPEDFYKSPARELLEAFAAFNPHATFVLDGERLEPTVERWKKWTPDQSLCPHWYTPDTFRELVSLHVAAERNGADPTTVRGFVSGFRGLSATAKQSRITEGFKGDYLSDLTTEDGRGVDREAVETLLSRMQEESQVPSPGLLGVIGEDHLTRWMHEVGGVVEGSVEYRKRTGESGGFPYVVEVAFGVAKDGDTRRRMVTGLNWSPTFTVPSDHLAAMIQEARLDRFDPVVLAVHIARPSWSYVERGKGKVEDIDGALLDDLSDAVRLSTKRWTKEKDRRRRVSERRRKELRSNQPKRISIKDAAFDVMEAAYMKASGGGQYYANARQIMYAARPMILELTDGKLWSNDSYFTQTILKDYLDERAPDWKVVWDARGHLREPHTGHSVDLGGANVARYVSDWRSAVSVAPSIRAEALVDTRGPRLRFGAVLWIEKEGFAPILEDAGFAERFDLGIMSSKGMTTKAAVELAQRLSRRGVQVFVVHDFDKSAFEILNTIRTGTRLLDSGVRDVVDLGFRLEDVEGLEPEPVHYPQQKDPRDSLLLCGATPEEADFLVQVRDWNGEWDGERVELNAMTSDQLVDWLEEKLREHGVEKVVPGAGDLAQGYRRAVVRSRVEDLVQHMMDDLEEIAVPDDLEERVRRYLEDHPGEPWERAVAACAA